MAAALDWMRKHSEWGVLDASSEEPGFGQCLWNVESNKAFKAKPTSGAATIVEALESARTQHASRKAVGWREVVKVHEVQEGSAKREKIELANEYKWLSYSEYYERVLSLARGLACVGVAPGARVVMYAETQRDWMTTAFASFYSNAQVVTVYATLGPDGAAHAVAETEASTLVADEKLLKSLIKLLPSFKSVKTIVTMTPCDSAVAEKIKAAGIALHSVDELVAMGKTWPFSPSLPKPADIAVIMYTSGTTGAPKGVVLTHANILACIAGVEHAVQGLITCDDVYLCYLPLAHIMEMVAELALMSFGAALGYGTPHTLTDNGVKLKRPESIGDAPCLQPTFMVFAPAVLDKVFQAVQTKRESLGGIGKKIFSWALASGERHFERGLIGANRIYNAIALKKVQKLVGGNLKAIITGSAPLSPDIQRFVQTVFDVPVRQGYGLTETCAGSCVGYWGDNALSNVGPPTVSACIRLADWAEGNYMNSDLNKADVKMRRGEVLIGGPSVCDGYFISSSKPNAELTKKNEEDWVEIKGQRFFRTGDIGQILPNGTLQIIDRKKDLWKGPNGEYVAFTKVEAALKLCPLVDTPMVYGKTGGSYPVALICPQKPRIIALGAELGLGDDFDILCQDSRVVDKVAQACIAQCKTQGLIEFEIPKRFALVTELWTPENEMLTAAMKLKRPIIAAKHKTEIDSLYA